MLEKFIEGHTERDWHALDRAGLRAAATQHREHSVACPVCMAVTWHIAGYCDAHYQEPWAAVAADRRYGITL